MESSQQTTDQPQHTVRRQLSFRRDTERHNSRGQTEQRRNRDEDNVSQRTNGPEQTYHCHAVGTQ